MADDHASKGYDLGENFDIQGAPPEDHPPDYYDAIMDVPDYKDIPPPPMYEPPKLEGVAPPPADDNQTQEYSTALVYADFLPQMKPDTAQAVTPVFQSFQTVMSIVNDWLRQNPNYQVLKVEDLERRINEKTWVLETETTIMHQPIYGSVCYVRGIRLWLVPNATKQPPQQLWYMNVVPKSIPIPVQMYHRMYGGYGMQAGMSTVLYFPNFETLGKTVNRLNAKLKQEPLPGRILSIVSSDVKYSDRWCGSKSFNPDLGMWRNQNSKNRLYLTILRAFFVVGDPQPVEIGVRDFAPAITQLPSSMGKPILENAVSVLQRAAGWLKQQKGIQTVSVQTVDSKVENNKFSGFSLFSMNRMGADDNDVCDTGEEQRAEHIRINPSSMHYQDGWSDTIFARTVRIFYFKNKAPSAQMGLTMRDFCPTRSGRTLAETTSQVAMRINSWLNQTGASGRVVGVDTLRFKFTPESKYRIRTEESRTVCQSNQSEFWLTILRLYLDGEYAEPPPEVRSATPAYINDSSGCCTIL